MTDGKRCTKCGEVKPLNEFHNNKREKDGKAFHCKSCRQKTEREYLPRRQVFLRYGVTVEQYNELLKKQGGVCAICGNPPTRNRLAVDHDHKTGKVRGLLCSNCNAALGMIRENVVLVAEMLKYIALNLPELQNRNLLTSG